jgi:predicted nucleic acid-binding protein
VAWYIDTSAFLKLLVAEAETPAMRSWFVTEGPHWSSQLLKTEAMRAAARLGIPDSALETALGTVTFVSPSVATFLSAGRLAPSSMRTLDALHLAGALELVPDVRGIVTYDAQLAQGAQQVGLAVVAPGRQ